MGIEYMQGEILVGEDKGEFVRVTEPNNYGVVRVVHSSGKENMYRVADVKILETPHD